MGETEKRAKLIDFFYKDLSRIESFFAQLYQGALKEVAATQSISRSTGKSYSLNAHVFESSGMMSSG